MAKVKNLTKNPKISFFSRGSDIHKYKIIKYIDTRDKFECLYLKEMNEKLKLSRNKISKIMNELEKKNKVKKINAYPVFWIKNGK